MLVHNWQTSTRLNRRCKVMQMAKVPDTENPGQFVKDRLGQYIVAPTEVCEIWCGVAPQTGSMLTGRQADTILTRTTHKVTIRYREGLGPEMWLDIDGVRYDILYILDPYLRHEVLEIFCEVKDYGRTVVTPIPDPTPTPETEEPGEDDGEDEGGE